MTIFNIQFFDPDLYAEAIIEFIQQEDDPDDRESLIKSLPLSSIDWSETSNGYDYWDDRNCRLNVFDPNFQANFSCPINSVDTKGEWLYDGYPVSNLSWQTYRNTPYIYGYFLNSTALLNPKLLKPKYNYDARYRGGQRRAEPRFRVSKRNHR